MYMIHVQRIQVARVVAFFIGINGAIIVISFYCARRRRLLLIPVGRHHRLNWIAHVQ